MGPIDPPLRFMDGPLDVISVAALLVEQLDVVVDLGGDGRLLGAPGLEQLGDAGEAAGDAVRAVDLARGPGQEGAGGDQLPLGDLDARPLGDVFQARMCPSPSSMRTCGCRSPPVLHDPPAGVPPTGRSRSASSRPRRRPRRGPGRPPRRLWRCRAGPTRRASCRGRYAGRPRPSSRRRRARRTSRPRGPWSRESGSRRDAIGRSAARRRS